MTEKADCETARNLTYHPLYRTSQFFQFFILFFAIFPLVYLIWFKLRKSSFHGNLKWLLAGYFGSILAFTLDFLVLVAIQIIVPMFSIDNCSLIIDRKFYGPANISGAFFMTLPTFFPISITIERFLATKFAEKYDQKPVFLGPILTILVVLLDLSIIFAIYKEESFEGGSVNLMLFPTTTAPKIYALFWVLLGLNVINIFFNLALLRRNSRLKTINCSLSAKYQLEEVYLSTVFSISVIFLHIFFYGIYTSIIMFSRYFGHLVIRNTLDLSAARGAQIMDPWSRLQAGTDQDECDATPNPAGSQKNENPIEALLKFADSYHALLAQPRADDDDKNKMQIIEEAVRQIPGISETLARLEMEIKAMKDGVEKSKATTTPTTQKNTEVADEQIELIAHWRILEKVKEFKGKGIKFVTTAKQMNINSRGTVTEAMERRRFATESYQIASIWYRMKYMPLKCVTPIIFHDASMEWKLIDVTLKNVGDHDLVSKAIAPASYTCEPKYQFVGPKSTVTVRLDTYGDRKPATTEVIVIDFKIKSPNQPQNESKQNLNKKGHFALSADRRD